MLSNGVEKNRQQLTDVKRQLRRPRPLDPRVKSLSGNVRPTRM